MLLKPNPVRQRLTISGVQIAAILGLENLLHAAGLILVCPHCLQNGDPRLDTDNGPHTEEWKVDCGCRERRIARTDVGKAMDGDGALAAAAESILEPIRLAVRCPESRCIQHPLEVERTPTHTILRCRCAKTTLRVFPPTIH